MAKKIGEGVVHKLPEDLRKVLSAHPEMHEAWEDITPLARSKLTAGERRPCCWPGCKHR